MRICCLTAHPDDLELGCAGTLLKFQEQGAVIDSVVLVKPSIEVRDGRTMQNIVDECHRSYEISGFNLKVHDTATFYNGRPNLTCDTNTITLVGELVKNTDYDLVMLPHPEDWHQDHRTVHDIGTSLFTKRATEIWTMDQWPYAARHAHGNIKVDITQQWEKKMSMICCYETYFTDPADLEEIDRTHKYWAVTTPANYCESFSLEKRYVR